MGGAHVCVCVCVFLSVRPCVHPHRPFQFKHTEAWGTLCLVSCSAEQGCSIYKKQLADCATRVVTHDKHAKQFDLRGKRTTSTLLSTVYDQATSHGILLVSCYLMRIVQHLFDSVLLIPTNTHHEMGHINIRANLCEASVCTEPKWLNALPVLVKIQHVCMSRQRQDGALPRRSSICCLHRSNEAENSINLILRGSFSHSTPAFHITCLLSSVLYQGNDI